MSSKKPVETKLTFPKQKEKREGWPWSISTSADLYCKDIIWPKISIITPSYNQGKFIEETIRSVLAQNYPNLEYIIIDGGSTDGSLEIIEKYKDHLTYWVSEPDAGQSHAINKGLEKCSGEIINWLNSDDWYMPDTLYQVASSFLSNQSVYAVSGYENHILTDGSTVLEKGTLLDINLEQTIERCQIAQPSTFFSARAFKNITPVPEDLHYIMDGELWVRFLLRYGFEGFLKLPVPLVNFRYHDDSKTVSNTLIDNFLYERSSIIVDLQVFVKVPDRIIKYWVKDVFKSPKVYKLNRSWFINSSFISGRQMRLYFIKKYIDLQLTQKNAREAGWGLKQLLLNHSYDLFMFKKLMKLVLTVIKNGV